MLPVTANRCGYPKPRAEPRRPDAGPGDNRRWRGGEWPIPCHNRGHPVTVTLVRVDAAACESDAFPATSPARRATPARRHRSGSAPRAYKAAPYLIGLSIVRAAGGILLRRPWSWTFSTTRVGARRSWSLWGSRASPDRVGRSDRARRPPRCAPRRQGRRGSRRQGEAAGHR